MPYIYIIMYIYMYTFMHIYIYIHTYLFIFIYTYCIPRFGENRICSSLKRKCFESLISLAETIPDLVFKRHFENKKAEIIVRLTVHACVAWVQTSSFLGPI